MWGFAASEDAGATWSEVSRTGENIFTLMAASRDAEGLVVARSGSQIFVTGDTGENWDWYTWANEVAGMEIVNGEGPVVLLASGGMQRLTYPEGTFETLLTGTFTGVDWHPAGVILAGPDQKFSVCDVGLADCTEGDGPEGATVVQYLAQADSNVLYALADNGDLYRSDDRGEVWYLAVDVP